MALRNTHTRYGSISRLFHWLTALLVITLIPVALIANELPIETSEQLARKAWLFSLHKTLGVFVFLVALARIAWALTQAKPAPLYPQKKTETFLAETVHWLLYGSLVLTPLSGWIHHAATAGFAPIWWPLGQGLPLVPKSEIVAALFSDAHWVFGKVMVVTIALHIAGAVKHQIIDRDATLRRMLNGAPELKTLPRPRHSSNPFISAVVIWAIALFAGTQFDLFSPEKALTDAVELEDVQSDWKVEEGDITITVTQFGSTVEGTFADWTADISFDPTMVTGISGNVEAVISIGSLTLGSVTEQALGPDFFDAANFATATYRAELITGVDGFLAKGALSLKEHTVTLDMPFRLSVKGDRATMEANHTLDRRNFGIGDNLPDEDSLAFAVKVAIKLAATRTSTQ